jgi:hypothetical protein
VLLAAEPFLFGGGHDHTVDAQGGGGVMQLSAGDA